MANGLGTFSKMFRKNAAARGLVQTKVHGRGKMSMEKVHALANNLDKHEYKPAMYKYEDPYKKGYEYMSKARSMGFVSGEHTTGDGGQFADPVDKTPAKVYHMPKAKQVQMRKGIRDSLLKLPNSTI
jgi:hypothetical protein